MSKACSKGGVVVQGIKKSKFKDFFSYMIYRKVVYFSLKSFLGDGLLL